MNIDHNYSISVLIPYHRVNELLYRCVNSVLNQKFRPVEIILINDGCPEKINFDRFTNTGIHIKEICLGKNSGPASARNIGFKSAVGNYISLLDSDDYWSVNKLLNQVAILKTYESEDDIIIVSSVTVTNKNILLKQRNPLIDYTETGMSKLLKAPFLYLGSTALFRKEIIRKYGPQVENLRVYEDFEWQIRLSEYFKIKFIVSGNPDVYIEKSRKTHNEHFLRKNFEEFLLCLGKRKTVNRAHFKFLKAMFHLDLASSYLNKRMYLKFIWHFFRSILFVPRTNVHVDKFWNEESVSNNFS